MTSIADLKQFTGAVDHWLLAAQETATKLAELRDGRERLIGAGRALGLRVPHLEAMLPLAAMTEPPQPAIAEQPPGDRLDGDPGRVAGGEDDDVLRIPEGMLRKPATA